MRHGPRWTPWGAAVMSRSGSCFTEPLGRWRSATMPASKWSLDDSVSADADQRHTLVRITREAVSNAIRHGRADRVRLRLTGGEQGRRAACPGRRGWIRCQPGQTRCDGVRPDEYGRPGHVPPWFVHHRLGTRTGHDRGGDVVTIRVVIADDHTRMRGRIRDALEAGGCDVCGEGASAADAVRLVTEHRPDVALLDIHMPGNGIQAAHDIAKARARGRRRDAHAVGRGRGPLRLVARRRLRLPAQGHGSCRAP